MLVLLLTGYLIILKQVSIGSISSVGQISGNIFNSLTTFNQLQVSISSVNIIFEKFGAFEKSSHYRYIDKDIEEIIENKLIIISIKLLVLINTIFSKINFFITSPHLIDNISFLFE